MLLKSLLAIAGVFLSSQVASGIEYTNTGIAIVGTTETLSVDVAAGASREDLISYEFASYIAVHFAGFDLPDGDSVVISSPDANVTVSHTYTGRGRDQSGTFIASFIPGNSVTVAYTSVGAATAGQGYRITGYSRGYPTMRQETICGDGDQSLPAKCYSPGSNLSEGLPQAYTKAQAVARLLINGSYLCTGWLGGSEGHVFTNHHCFEQEDWALTTDFEFGAESSSCSDQCETQLGCAGTIVATTSTFVADSEDIDYSVVKLPDCVDLSPYGYLQLREAGPEVNESMYVPQHPDGYAKRIVSTVDGGDNSSIRSVGQDGDCGTDQVGHDADTQGGSSGSPLLASSDNLVVAIHHCGGCTNTAIDVRTVLTDLASKNITIQNLMASDDVGQSSPPLYAQTPCSASKTSTHTGNNSSMPCQHLTKQGSSKTALGAAAPNATSTVVTASKMTASSTPAATVAASTIASKTTSTRSSTTATSSSKTVTTSASKAALTSASVVTSKAGKMATAAPSTAAAATKTSSTSIRSVTSSSSSKTTPKSSTSTSTSTKVSTSATAKSTAAETMTPCDSTPTMTLASIDTTDTADNDAIVGKLKAAVIDSSSTPCPHSTTTGKATTPITTRATVAPHPTPSVTSASPSATPVATKLTTPTPTTMLKPSTANLIIAGVTPKPLMPCSTPTSTSASPSGTPAPIKLSMPSPTSTAKASTPSPTPASTTVSPSATPAATKLETSSPTAMPMPSTASPTTAAVTPKPSTPSPTPAPTTVSPSAKPVDTKLTTPTPTPASTLITSSSGRSEDVEQN